jgi:hypothetical protein
MQNRRKHARVPMRAQVVCIVDSQTLRGVSRNLSHGRIPVEVPDLQTNDTVQLTFRIPVSQALVDAIGAVVWTAESDTESDLTALVGTVSSRFGNS